MKGAASEQSTEDRPKERGTGWDNERVWHAQIWLTHLGCEGQQGLDDGVGGDEGHKLGVDHLDLVHVLAHKVCIQLV